jgi:hypothetical protein
MKERAEIMFSNLERINNSLFERNVDNKRFSLTNTLLVGINDWDNKSTEEVFISYPNIENLKEFISECVDMLQSNEVFNKKNNTINVSHKDDMITSEDFPNESILCAIPDVISDEESGRNVRAICFLVNNEDTFITLDDLSVFNLYYILEDIVSLTELSNQTFLMAMIADGGSVSSSGGSKNSSGNSPLKRRNIKGITTGKSSSFKKSKKRNLEEDEEEDYEEEEDTSEEYDEEDDDDEEAGVSIKRNGKSSKKSNKASGSKKKTISLNSLMVEAENTDFSDDEEEEE